MFHKRISKHRPDIDNSVDPKWTKQHTSTAIALPYILAAEELIGKEQTLAILSKLQIPRAYFEDSSLWVSSQFYDSLFEFFPNDEAISKLAIRAAEIALSPKTMSMKIFARIGYLTPKVLFNKLAESMENLNKTRVYKISETSDNHIVLQVLAPDRSIVVKNKVICNNWKVSFKTLVKIVTGFEGVVIKESCIFQNAEACTYRISWQNRQIVRNFLSNALPIVAITVGTIGTLYSKYLNIFGYLCFVGSWLASKAKLTTLTDEIRRNYEQFDEKYKELQAAKEIVDQKVIEKTKEIQEKDAKLAHHSKIITLGHLTATLSHELGGSIGRANLCVQSLTNAISDQAESEFKKEALEDCVLIKSSILSSLEIIRHVRSYGQFESHKIEDINIFEIAKTVIGLNAYSAIGKTAKLENKVPPGFTSKGYKTSFYQILMNLVINAVYALDKTKKNGLVTIEAKDLGNTWLLSVQDNGLGIPDDIKDRIWDRYFTTKPQKDGSGEGLNIVAMEVVKNHGKIIKPIKSTVGVGTTFEFEFPKNFVNEEEVTT